MPTEYIFFGSFLIAIALMLLIDLGVFSRESHVVSFKEAAIWSGVWVVLALGFYVFLTQYGQLVHGIETEAQLNHVIEKYGEHAVNQSLSFAEQLAQYRKHLSIEFITGYLIEYSLSIDNIFVILLIFTSFGVSQKHYKQVLFWGILGAVIMRFAFIFLGAALIQNFGWILYVFGAFLVFSGIKMFLQRNNHDTMETKDHKVVKFLSKFFKISNDFKGDKFVYRDQNGVRWVTPLLVVLIIIELTDLVFAIDSVPAIFAVTRDPYIVFFSNIFAIMGLRSMFFFLANIMHLFRFLKHGLAVLLTFIGIKMVFHHWLHSMGFETKHSLIIIITILGVSVLASLMFPARPASTKVNP